MEDSAASSSPTPALEIGGGVTIELVRIEPGQYLAGDPPGVLTEVTRPFLLGKHLVTRRQFAAFVAASGHITDAEREGKSPGVRGSDWLHLDGAYWRVPGFEQGEDHPAVCVSPNDGLAMCRWIAETTGRPARLPRDAEWEYACRAGTTSAFFWGEDPMVGVGYMNAEDGVWHLEKGIDASAAELTWSDGYRFTSPVGAMKPNAWGLHDMLGNLWEPTMDPNSWRGGTWDYPPHFNRCAHRQGMELGGHSWDTGLRIAVDVD